eukprot:15449327-Alexandrium_andersonii.AAC.1
MPLKYNLGGGAKGLFRELRGASGSFGELWGAPGSSGELRGAPGSSQRWSSGELSAVFGRAPRDRN